MKDNIKRREDGKNTLKSMLGYSIANIVTMVASLIAIPILTSIISVSDLGIATSFTTLQNILTIVCLLSVYISIDRMLIDVKKDEFGFLSSIYLVSTITATLFLIIYLIFRNYLNDFLGFNTELMLFMFTFIILINGCTILVAYWNFKNKYKLTFLYNLFVSPVSQAVSIILAAVLVSNKYYGRIIGLNVFNSVIGLISGIYILYKGKFKFDLNYIKKAFQICLPMIPHLLSQILLTSCDLLMIKNISGAADAGIYSMAYTISNILYCTLLQIFSPWSPWFYRRLDLNEVDSIKNNSNLLISISFILCVGLFTISPEMIKIFLSDNYIDAIYIVAPICVGIFFQIIHKFFYDVEYFNKKTKMIAIFSVIAAIVNIILNFYGIKYIGYQVAAYTTLISYGILLILHYFGMRTIEKRKIFDIKYLSFISLILLFICIVNLYYINSIFIRYIILFILMLLFIFKHKTDLLNIVNTILFGNKNNEKKARKENGK